MDSGAPSRRGTSHRILVALRERRIAKGTPGTMMAALLAALALGGCGAAATSTTSPQPLRGTPLLSIFEDEHLLHADPAGAMTTFQELGADVVRVYVAWTAIAPDPNVIRAHPTSTPRTRRPIPRPSGDLRRDRPRRRRARDRASISSVGAGGPLWATGHGDPSPRACATFADAWDALGEADYGAFVHALGVRYGGHYTPAGRTCTAAPRGLLVDLERAELRRRPCAAGDRLVHRVEVSPMLLPRAARRSLDGTRRHRAHAGRPTRS